VKIIVAIATVGRANLSRQTVDFLADLIRQPDQIIVIGASLQDVAGVESARGQPNILIARRGLCCQRNAALDLVRGENIDTSDVALVFIDDDFIPAPDFLVNIEAIFERYPDVVGITGELIADGIHNAGYTVEDGVRLIANHGTKRDDTIRPRRALYGCNMAIRLSAAQGLSFDEALPLYGWQEDIDFTYQLSMRGRLISTGLVTGVHLGTKGGRTSGKRVGYSQIANIVYLRRKGTMQPGLGEQLIRQNLVSNVIRSFRPEAHIDRRGRLLGNLIAIKDLITGRIDPRRIESM
jgi:glycosyltransferase involved in cell wall biosynthesis